MENQSKYEVIVSEKASKMLVSNAAFIAQVSTKAANRFISDFENAAHSLENMPQRCAWLKGEYIPTNTYRYILFAKHYMLIYKIVDTKVYVELVVDCRQDYRWLI